MSAMMERLAERWAGYTGREQALLAALAAIGLLVVVVYLGIIPGLESARSAESRRTRARTELVEVQALSKDVQAMRQLAAKTPAAAASEIIREAAAAHGVSLLEARPAGEEVHVQAQATSSAGALNWLKDVSGKTAMSLASVTITPESGRTLNVEARFSRTGP